MNTTGVGAVTLQPCAETLLAVLPPHPGLETILASSAAQKSINEPSQDLDGLAYSDFLSFELLTTDQFTGENR